MTRTNDGTAQPLDELLAAGTERWAQWRGDHIEPVDDDRFVSVMGDLIETLLPPNDAALQRLAVDPRVWSYRDGDDGTSVRDAVTAALTSLIADHLGQPGPANIS